MSSWKIRVGTRSFDIDVKERGYGGYAVTVDGKARDVSVEQADWGLAIQIPGSVPARAAPPSLPAPGRVAPDVHAKPQKAEPAAPPPRPAAPVVMTGNVIPSPMPGKVVKVLVEPGREVKAGDPLCVLESMKMENTVSAPRAGKIARLHVKVGDAPNTGMPIAEYE